MNHLPLLLSVMIAIVAGLLWFGAYREDKPSRDEPEELEPPPEALRPDGTKVDLSVRLPEFAVNDIEVVAALEELGARLDCPVRLSDAAAGRLASTTLTLSLTDVGVPTVLNLLTEPYGVVYRVHGGVLWILMPGEEPTETGR